MDKQLVLIDRVQALQESLDGQTQYARANPTVPVQVVDLGNIPTTVPAVFACKPVRVAGPVGEGQTPTIATINTIMYVVVFGTSVPVAGDYLQARRSGSRWYAQEPSACASKDGTLCFRAPGCGLPGGADHNTITITDSHGHVVGTSGAGHSGVGWGACIDKIHAGTYTATITSDEGPSASTPFTYPSPCAPMTVTIPGYGCPTMPRSLALTGIDLYQVGTSTTFTYQDRPADIQGRGAIGAGFSILPAQLPDQVWVTPSYANVPGAGAPTLRYILSFIGCLAVVGPIFVFVGNPFFNWLYLADQVTALGGVGDLPNTCIPFNMTRGTGAFPITFSLTGDQSDSVPFTGTMGNPFVVAP